MTDETNDGLRERLARSGEDALGRLAQDLLENPLVSSAISRAFEAREKAVQAQGLAMGALNLPSAADVERLTRRLRSVSQRLEGIEDGVDRLDDRLATLGRQAGLQDELAALGERLAAIEAKLSRPAKAAPAARGGAQADRRLAAIEAQLATIAEALGRLQGSLAVTPPPLPREQERLKVDG